MCECCKGGGIHFDGVTSRLTCWLIDRLMGTFIRKKNRQNSSDTVKYKRSYGTVVGCERVQVSVSATWLVRWAWRVTRWPKLQLLYCSLSVYSLLFIVSYYLSSPILWSVFLSLWSVILPRCIECRAVSSGESCLSVCLSVCLSFRLSFRASVCLSYVCIGTKWKKDLYRILYLTKDHLD